MEVNEQIKNEDINLELLSQKEKYELFLFYKYLLFKSDKSKNIKKVKKKNEKWNNLEKFLSVNRFDLPENYKFNRDEIYDR